MLRCHKLCKSVDSSELENNTPSHIFQGFSPLLTTSKICVLGSDSKERLVNVVFWRNVNFYRTHLSSEAAIVFCQL